MSTTSPAHSARRTKHHSNSTRRTSTDFARQTTIAAFGWRHTRALDQADFLDRPPGQFPLPSPEARTR